MLLRPICQPSTTATSHSHHLCNSQAVNMHAPNRRVDCLCCYAATSHQVQPCNPDPMHFNWPSPRAAQVLAPTSPCLRPTSHATTQRHQRTLLASSDLTALSHKHCPPTAAQLPQRSSTVPWHSQRRSAQPTLAHPASNVPQCLPCCHATACYKCQGSHRPQGPPRTPPLPRSSDRASNAHDANEISLHAALRTSDCWPLLAPTSPAAAPSPDVAGCCRMHPCSPSLLTAHTVRRSAARWLAPGQLQSRCVPRCCCRPATAWLPATAHLLLPTTAPGSMRSPAAPPPPGRSRPRTWRGCCSTLRPGRCWSQSPSH